MHDIKKVLIGTIVDNTFPIGDDYDATKVYFYKRTNGHIYTYQNGVETHVCCNDGLITNLPKFTTLPSIQNPPIHRPDMGHFMLFEYEGIAYMYDHELVVTPLSSGGGGGDINGIIEW